MRARLDTIRNYVERYVPNSWAMEKIIDELEELRREIAELEKASTKGPHLYQKARDRLRRAKPKQGGG